MLSSVEHSLLLQAPIPEIVIYCCDVAEKPIARLTMSRDEDFPSSLLMWLSTQLHFSNTKNKRLHSPVV